MTLAYYNEIDEKACAALRQLVQEQIIAPGFVDQRSIKEVQADELRHFTQWHFFAGGGLWSVAARIAGWPDDRPLGTASCPCQPFSGAGKQAGTDDPRHLWPDLFRIIRTARAGGFGPAVWMGEQVAKAAGYGWFDGVRADLATEGIASRTVDIPACAIDAPHERNRLYWVAVANAQERSGGTGLRQGGALGHGIITADGHGGDVVLANAESRQRGGIQPLGRSEGRAVDGRPDAGRGSVVDATGIGWGEGRTESIVLGGRSALTSADAPRHLDHTERAVWQGHAGHGDHAAGWRQPNGYAATADDAPRALPRRNGSHFADWEWIACHDGKARRAKPGIPMLVDGMAGRSDLWSLAGNSISPILAAEVIGAFLDAECAAPTVLTPPPY